MKGFVVSLALAAAGLGLGSLVDRPPTAIDARHFHHCAYGDKFCGTPEPDGCTGKCEYWVNCGNNCGCRRIQNCTP